ncbi:ACT domain-containing ACR9-like [Micractinium conductrix]|uniref:ACT domain-containing ACR9-like n=1 Tax=Micractinium conductrix TaxID=554055 RepID=A0A2P6VB35_9CHLO|nr:ACT domain-containing ACR9-like [Micractinium conductrix]|eukprot:PSC71312.1 ACT domain-containing ACR9-like [Micractinium conductrix]
MDLEEETVIIRRLPDEDLSMREVRISCPDATGLGVDIARMLLDFGLRILKGDISTDGSWCFLIFKVCLSSGVPPRWQLLKSRLEGICPKGTDTLQRLWRWRSVPKEQPPFLLQVAGYDRQGMLHSLSHALWESDTTVFKAHITTSPNGKVSDMFWLYDNRNELPESHRVLEICDRVKGALGPDTECTITPAPPDSLSAGTSASSKLLRKACKDVTSTSNLRRIVGSKKQLVGSSSEAALKDSFAGRQAEVEVTVDNETSPSHTMLTLRCRDRKGLLYDLFRSLKDMDLRVAYGKIEVYEEGMCEVDLFVQDVEGTRISDSELLQELIDRVRTAVALPVLISLKDSFDATCTELTISANIDSGGRGRPRVTFDVTQGLSAAGVGVFMADVYIEQPDLDAFGLPVVGGPQAQEVHRFLIHMPSGQPVSGDRDKKAIYDVVKAHLMGTSVQQQQLAATAAGSLYAATGGGGLSGAPFSSAASAPLPAGPGGEQQSNLLRALSGKWKGKVGGL